MNTSILDEFTQEHINYMIEKIPIGRMGRTEEIASAVYFLSLEESAYITGQVLHVNGGLTM